MLLASGATLLFTTGLALYDFFSSKQKTIPQEGKDKKRNYQTIKLLLTGGPCGGKSEGINCIYHSFKRIAAPVFIVPEAATIIGTAGLTLDLSQFEPRQIELFQIYLMRLQYNLEEIVLNIATQLQKLEKTPVVLCDRGLLDGKAYAGKQNWAKMLRQVNITEEEILSRYKAVVHMVTAAKGAEDFYNFTLEEQQRQKSSEESASEEGVDGLKVRRQTPEMAVALDGKLQACYKNHSNRYVISNEFFVKSFQDKKTVLLAQIWQIMSQIIQRNDLDQYYHDYDNVRKGSQQNITLVNNPSPYLIRKRKFQRFLHRGQSPVRKNSTRKGRGGLNSP